MILLNIVLRDIASCSTISTLLVLFVLLLVYIYAQYPAGRCKFKIRMDGKTVIVTGCTSGIGKETARKIASRGCRLIMACRNVELANKFKGELIQETSNSNIVVRKLNLSSLSSVREFARQINLEENRLDLLIHNAATAETFSKKVTEDGLEMTMATNQYGPFLLTHLLIDLLKRSKPSRIVVVASGLYYLSRLNLNNTNPTTTFPSYLYFVSKYANIVFTLELARRLEGTGVTANCLHPGIINTGIWKNVPPPFSWMLNFILNTFFRTIEQGAQTTLYVALSDKLNGVSGKYFADCSEQELIRSVQDPELGKKFWEISEGLVKLQPEDPKI